MSRRFNRCFTWIAVTFLSFATARPGPCAEPVKPGDDAFFCSERVFRAPWRSDRIQAVDPERLAEKDKQRKKGEVITATSKDPDTHFHPDCFWDFLEARRSLTKDKWDRMNARLRCWSVSGLAEPGPSERDPAAIEKARLECDEMIGFYMKQVRDGCKGWLKVMLELNRKDLEEADVEIGKKWRHELATKFFGEKGQTMTALDVAINGLQEKLAAKKLAKAAKKRAASGSLGAVTAMEKDRPAIQQGSAERAAGTVGKPFDGGRRSKGRTSGTGEGKAQVKDNQAAPSADAMKSAPPKKRNLMADVPGLGARPEKLDYDVKGDDARRKTARGEQLGKYDLKQERWANVENLDPKVLWAAGAAASMIGANGYKDVTITSGNDGCHAGGGTKACKLPKGESCIGQRFEQCKAESNSCHYNNLAVDIKANYLSIEEAIRIGRDMQRKLDREYGRGVYFVGYEQFPDPGNNHFHIQHRDCKARRPSL